MTAPRQGEATGSQPSASSPLAAEELPPGTQFGPYIVLEMLGRGGMGAVYRARHSHLHRVVALKVLAPGLQGDARGVARFQREMLAIGQLDHPNVVRATDAGWADGRPYLVMDYVPGVSLSGLVQLLGPLPSACACDLVRQAALGLQAVHERGLVHRDVKPSNLLLTTGGQVKVLDLGVALLAEGHLGNSELTGTGQVIGTADYMAPEQGEASHGVDIRADVYSMGCTLYKLLTGQVPYNNPAHNSLYRKIRAHAEEPIPDIGAQRDVPPGLAVVLNRLLAKKPADRFATPAEVAAALEPFGRGADLLGLLAAVLPGHADRADGSPEIPADHHAVTTPHLHKAVTTPGPIPTPAPAAPAGRRRWPWLSAAVALLGGLAAALLLWRGRPDQARPDIMPRGTSDHTAAGSPSPAPGVWNPLLQGEPAVLRWPAPGKNSHRLYRPAERELILSCEGLGLLALGQTTAPRYQLAITIQQNPWTGNVGLFFGYQDRVTSGQPAQFYQAIELVGEPARGQDRLFHVDWKLVHHIGPANFQRQVSETIAMSNSFGVLPQEHRLELAVGLAGLEAVSWDGEPLARLNAKMAARPPRPDDNKGTFGILASTGSGVFREACYLYREEL